MSYTVRHATLAAVRASISMPVLPVTPVVVVIWMPTRPSSRSPSSTGVHSTLAFVMFNGWHIGMSVLVCLAAITPATAAVLVEVVQGEGGIVPLPGDYLRGVEALCRKHDILFICDEVQAGLCRTGTFWAFQQHGLTPDAISMAKSLANGLPMGAMLATDEMAKGFEAGSHATTFGGGALASGVAAKCVEIMLRDKLADRAAELGKHVMDRVRAIQDKLPGTVREVRGLGLMIGIELAVDAAAVWRELIARGFICNLSHGVTLRLLPALTIDKADLDAFIDTLEDILRTAK